MKHIKGLDTLRAFAVFFVIIAHWRLPILGEPSPAEVFIQRFFVPDGATGVYLFFVLSGFLITSILLNARMENDKDQRFSVVKNFIVRRALRIFPGYFLTIFLLYLAFPDIKDNLLYLLTYTLNIVSYQRNDFVSSFAHSWSLSIEEQFYIFWPWLILFINGKYLKYLFIAAITTGIASTYYSMGILHKIEPFAMFNCMDGFGIGGLYAYMRLNSDRAARFEKVIKRIVPVFIAIYFFWKIMAYIGGPEYSVWFSKTVVSIISVWLIMLAIKPRHSKAAKSFWENRFLGFVGKVSYGIYLYHPYMYRMNNYIRAFIDDRIVHNPFWHDLLTNYYFLYWLNFAVLMLLCWLSYTLLEKPLLNLKRFFTYKQRAV